MCVLAIVVCEKCDISDLKMMQSLKLENRDGHLDKAEYIILCMLRLRAIDPELVLAINKQFDSLDVDSNGLLEYAELLEASHLIAITSTVVGPLSQYYYRAYHEYHFCHVLYLS